MEIEEMRSAKCRGCENDEARQSVMIMRTFDQGNTEKERVINHTFSMAIASCRTKRQLEVRKNLRRSCQKKLKVLWRVAMATPRAYAGESAVAMEPQRPTSKKGVG